MFLKKEKLYTEVPIILVIITYAYLINWYSGNIGIIPIDSFAFLDTGYSIIFDHLPVRDFWIFTGLLVDYMEAAFLYLLGNNWNSHLAHGSFMNIIGTLGLYFFLREYEFKLHHIVFYCLSFATLCYPLSGTPFAYMHAYIFSLLAIFTLLIAIKNNSKILWFSLPFLYLFAFLSMQTPTVYILIILFIIILYHFLITKKFENLKYFIYGNILSFCLFALFLFYTDTPIKNFLYQYILFPLTIGEGRITSKEVAYIGLIDQLNFKRLFSEFKFIHFILAPLIFFSLKILKKKDKNINVLNFLIIFSSLAFFFNQLITANQIYIFSLIPLLAAILHLNLQNLKISPRIFYLIFLLVIFSSVKFHLRFNIDRKFHDLENVDKNYAISANLIDKNFKSLKWVSKFDDPENETSLIKEAIKIIDNDQRKKVLVTHYQFMSTILNKPLYIFNRWYLWDNNTHPTENHKYFDNYKSLVKQNIEKNEIQVIYILGQEKEIEFANIKNYFTNTCFESKTIIPNRFSLHKLVECKK